MRLRANLVIRASRPLITFLQPYHRLWCYLKRCFGTRLSQRGSPTLCSKSKSCRCLPSVLFCGFSRLVFTHVVGSRECCVQRSAPQGRQCTHFSSSHLRICSRSFGACAQFIHLVSQCWERSWVCFLYRRRRFGLSFQPLWYVLMSRSVNHHCDILSYGSLFNLRFTRN